MGIMDSFQSMAKVPEQDLQERLESVKHLRQTDLELYEIVKDKETGEHYLHYAYKHLDVAQGGKEEYYHHLLPMENDDVLAVLFGDQPYVYPEHWQRPYLRNGPEGFYVWYQPLSAQEYEKDAEMAQKISEKLLRLKRQGETDEEKVRRLLADIDRLWDE